MHQRPLNRVKSNLPGRSNFSPPRAQPSAGLFPPLFLPAALTPTPGRSQPRSRVKRVRVSGAVSRRPGSGGSRPLEPGAGQAAVAATSGCSPRPERHTSRLCPRDDGAQPSLPLRAHGHRSVRRRRLSPRPTTALSPPAAWRPPRRPSPSPAPPPPRHSPFLAGTPREAPGTASAPSLRDTEGHSPRRFLPPLLLLPPLGPRPSPPPPPPAPPSAPAPAPPAILLLPPPPPPSPLLSVVQAPGLLQVPLAAILTPRGSRRGSARRGPGAPARRCGAGPSSRPPPPPPSPPRLRSRGLAARALARRAGPGRRGGSWAPAAVEAECARIIPSPRWGAQRGTSGV
ncbi:uncharacterized protein LOC144378904 [Halichoerus grypus]